MFHIITGAMGNGKSLYAMSRIEQFVKDGWLVYTNITGVTMEGVLPIPENAQGQLDWQLTPSFLEAQIQGKKGSAIFYDEAQRLEYFQYKAREKLSPLTVISGIETHRKQGYEIFFITQSPKFLHTHLHDLVNIHYHVTRPNGFKRSVIFMHNKYRAQPDSEASIALAEDIIYFNHPERLFDKYQSTEDSDAHNIKRRIPKEWYKLMAIIAACVVVIIWVLFGTNMKWLNSDNYSMKASDHMKDAKKPASETTVQNPLVHDPLTPAQRLDLEKRALEQKQLETHPSVTAAPVQTITYDPNKPFENQFAPRGGTQPYLTGCIQVKTKCSCYTQQGSKLDVSIADCKKVINEGMPYNPFLAQTQPVAPVQSPALTIPAPAV